MEKPGREHKALSQQANPLWLKAEVSGERVMYCEAPEFILSRKATIVLHVPVPQTDTGSRGENPQASGRSVVKELGKITP